MYNVYTMTIDGLTLHYAAEEIKNEIIGCKVDKVHQPRPSTLVLSLRAPGKNIKLLICAGAFDSRMHMTQHKLDNPKKPPMFCMFLRKYITGSKVSAVEQDGLERIVNITLEAKDELGLPHKLTMVCELMGKYSNVILVDENDVIMDSLRHITQSLSRVRQVMPSLEYVLPQSTKLNLLTISEATLVEMLSKRGARKIESYLSQFLQGVSKNTAQELLYRYQPSGYEELPREPEKLASIILSFVEDLNNLCPTVYTRSKPFFYSPIDYKSITARSKQTYSSINEMIDEFYKSVQDFETINRKRAAMSKQVSKRIDKLSHVVKKQHDTMLKAKKAEKFRAYGDLITANIYRITKGMKQLEAIDYESGETVNIPLDTRLSPSANAQLNYKKYNKRKAGLPITAKRMSDNNKEINFLESIEVSLENCNTLDELTEIEFELSKAGVISQQAAKQKATKEPSKPYKFVSSDGITILAGKNNRQNDALTIKTAEPNDIWLHTKEIPGSHVLIKHNLEDLPDTTLLEAAAIAVVLSKAKNSQKVPVDYAPRKNIRKPNGSKPGMVVYEEYYTVYVDPDKELFEKLLVQ